MKKLGFFVLFLLIGGCIEPYEFVVRDTTPGLVVEGFISDKSFSETLSYPSDGRYFTVKLTQTGDVTNVRPKPVNGAIVELFASDGETWIYTPGNEGVYTLYNDDFKAQTGVAYKLRILLSDQNIYESEWEEMPYTDVPIMGEIGFTETEKQMYVMESDKWELKTKQTVTVNVNVQPNNTREPLYYRWSYFPTWIYIAPLVQPTDPVGTCWASDMNYLSSYGLQIDQSGGYKKDLFDFPTVRNERIFYKLSVLVTQHAMTESYFSFWREMKEQNEGSALSDTPPYNLKTNFTSSGGGSGVSGYFGVTSEQARRWYFDKSELSYNVPNTLREDCLKVYGPGPPAEECTDCRFYSFGKATVTKPSWWAY